MLFVTLMSVASRRGVAAGRVQGECAVLPVACTMDVAGLARWATCVFARAGWFEDSHDFVVAVFRDGRFLVAIWFETRGSWCLH